jgi:hypothetical protein
MKYRSWVAIFALVLGQTTNLPHSTTLTGSTLLVTNPTVGVIQAKSCLANATTCNVSITPTAAGHSLFVSTIGNYANTLSTPSDGTSTYNVANVYFSDSANQSAATESWIANNVTSGAKTITCGQSANVGQVLCVAVEIYCPLGCSTDQTPTANTIDASTVSSNATGTLAQASEVAIGCFGKDNAAFNGLPLPAAGWSIMAGASQLNGTIVCLSRVTNSTAALTATATLIGGANHVTFNLATFE